MVINNASFLAFNAPTTRGTITSDQDHNDGLASFTVDTDVPGNLTGAAKGRKDPLVVDYNFAFNEPHFNADDNWGCGEQIGGKFGVIADLLGKKGAPVYLGATSILNTTQSAGNQARLVDTMLPEIGGQTRISYKGKLLSLTPKAASKTIGDAAAWYRAEMSKLAGMIDKDLSLQSQMKQAAQLAEELMNGAAASLLDPALASTLREAFARPSIEKLVNETKGAGTKLWESVLEKLTAPVDKSRRWFEPGACFAAGTLVHTKEGLVPIEQIKVGDWVLSKPENGGEQAYKRVLKTFVQAAAPVMEILYELPDEKNRFWRLIVTFDHPFWVKGLGWTAARNIPGMIVPQDEHLSSEDTQLELADGTLVSSGHPKPIYISDQPGIGWSPSRMSDPRLEGDLWDYVNHRLVANDVHATDAVRNSMDDDTYTFHGRESWTYEALSLQLPVYNFEVEDFHTYYVGKHGVWVHNTNCGGLTFEVKPPGRELTAEMKSNAHLSRKQLLDDLEQKIPNVADQQSFADALLVRAGLPTPVR